MGGLRGRVSAYNRCIAPSNGLASITNMTTNVTIKYSHLPNGRNYFYKHWIPEAARGLVVFLHDIGDHIGRYDDLALKFSERGFAFTLFDQRGHGKSDGSRGHISSLSELVDDVAGFVGFSKAELPDDTPIFVMGYGLGAIVAAHFVLMNSVRVNGFIALSALIQAKDDRFVKGLRVLKKLEKFWPSMPMRSPFESTDLANDAKVLDELDGDSVFHNRLTLGTACEIERFSQIVMALPHRIHLPALMLAGEDDMICDPDGTRMFWMRLSSADKECDIYPGMQHDILHGAGSEKVVEDVLGWLDARTRLDTTSREQLPLDGRSSVWGSVQS
jgi:alpha-beta hydrolase superfamily lysophospholipase